MQGRGTSDEGLKGNYGLQPAPNAFGGPQITGYCKDKGRGTRD